MLRVRYFVKGCRAAILLTSHKCSIDILMDLIELTATILTLISITSIFIISLTVNNICNAHSAFEGSYIYTKKGGASFL